jgi:hypothetical protein
MLLRNQKSILNVLVLLILTMFLTSCGTAVKQLDIFKTEVPKPNLALADPDPIVLEKIEWIFITSENQEEIFAKLQESNIDQVLFGLTDEQYENLSKNNAQLRAYIVELKEILNQYREYYEPKEK